MNFCNRTGPATVNNWLFRAAKQCEEVNEDLMTYLNVSKVVMDELGVIVKKVVPRTKVGDDGVAVYRKFCKF